MRHFQEHKQGDAILVHPFSFEELSQTGIYSSSGAPILASITLGIPRDLMIWRREIKTVALQNYKYLYAFKGAA